MGILNKLKFWHKDETGLGDLSLDTTPEIPIDKPLPSYEQSLGLQPSFSIEQTKGFGLEQEIKLLSAKMETLIAKIETLNQRIAHLERIAEEAQR